MVKGKTKYLLKKTVAAALSAAMMTSMLPGTVMADVTPSETDTIYYNFNNVTNYKALTPGANYLFVSQDVQMTTYNGKQAIINIPAGSAKLKVFDTIDKYEKDEEEEEETCTIQDLYRIYDGDDYTMYHLYDMVSFEAYMDTPLGEYLETSPSQSDAEAIEKVLAFIEEDFGYRGECTSWEEFPQFADELYNAYFKAYYEYMYKTLPTDDELYDYVNSLLSVKYDGYWGKVCTDDYVEAMVDVVQKGAGFDNCVKGTIAYQTKDEDIYSEYSDKTYTTRGTGWFYACAYGGVAYVGPFYLYEYDETTFSAEDIIVRKNENYPDNPTQVTKDQITVAINVGNKKVELQSGEYTLENDGNVTADGITVKIGKVTVTVPASEAVPEYDVSFTDGVGSGAGTYEVGETVTINATDLAGKAFKEWTGLDGLEITEGSATSSKVSFTMPEKNVALTANYETSYNISLKVGEGGTAEVAKKAAAGKKVTVKTTPDEGKVASIVVYKKGDTKTKVAVKKNSFTMPEYDVTVKVTFQDAPKDAYTYNAKDNKLTATCDLTCGEESAHTASLTITANSWYYDGEAKIDKVIKIAGADEWYELFGPVIFPPVLFYTDEACTKLTTKANGVAHEGGIPTMPGQYYAAITLEGKTAKDPFKILKKSGPEAPAPKTEKTSEYGAKDGKITGVNDAMEYSSDAGKTWTSVKKGATAIKGLAAGTYQVRVKETATVKAGAVATVKIAQGPVKEPTKAEIKQNALALNAGLKVSQTGDKINVKWGKVSGADEYLVYAVYCGLSKMELVATLKGEDSTNVSFTKLAGKKINTKKNFRVIVKARKGTASKKVIIGKTVMAHIVGKDNKAYTNAKGITVTNSKVTLKAGKSTTLKARTVLVDSSKKQLGNNHAAEFRYATANAKVAKVDKTGKITAIAKGTTTVYVYSRNGYAKAVTVTVS